MLTLGLAVAAAGCSRTFEACTTVGWSNAVTVELSGDVARVDTLILCPAAGCPADGLDAEDLGLEDGVPDAIAGTPASDGTWSFLTYDMATPDQVTIRAVDVAGATLTEQTRDATWIRTGGSARCGGPHTGTVQLTIA